MAHDWKRITPEGIIRRAIDRLDAKGKGVLLLHDIHERTATALPALLVELKARGYRIVHVVPATPELPATPTETHDWVYRAPDKPSLPVLLLADVTHLNQNLAEQRQMSGVDFCGEKTVTRSRRFAGHRHAWHRRHRAAKAAATPARREAAATTMRTD